MKKRTLISCIALVAVIASCGGDKETTGENAENKDTVANETKAIDSSKTDAEMPPIDSAAAMKAWQDYMKPGDMHALLGKFSGKWETEVKMWMNPQAPPMISKGTTENKMILGGRYQESVHTGSFDGMAFEGKSWLSYDNALKKFKSVWLDNMGTGMMILDGTYDEATKTFNFSGNMIEPSTGKECGVREVMKIVDDNTQTFEMYSNMLGEETKTMEITYKRKK